MCVFHASMEVLGDLQVEHSILEKEHVTSFIQQISEVIDRVRDKPQAAPATATATATAAAAATEGPSVQPPSDAKSDDVADELDCGSIELASSINFSPPCSSSPSHLQKETKTEGGSEVE